MHLTEWFSNPINLKDQNISTTHRDKSLACPKIYSNDSKSSDCITYFINSKSTYSEDSKSSDHINYLLDSESIDRITYSSASKATLMTVNQSPDHTTYSTINESTYSEDSESSDRVQKVYEIVRALSPSPSSLCFRIKTIPCL